MPIVSVTVPLLERMTALQRIYNECAIKRNLPIYLWNAGWGYFKQVKSDLEKQVSFLNIKLTCLQLGDGSMISALNCLSNCNQDGIFILENLSSLTGNITSNKNFSHKIISQIINIYYDWASSVQSKYLIILTNENVELPQSLSSLIPTLLLELPNHEEIADFIKVLLPKFLGELSCNGDIAAIVNAASGLTAVEIRLGLTLAVNSSKQLNINSVASYLLDYKINRFRALNLNFVTQPNLPDFGGLDLLKKYIENVKQDFSPEARTANIPLPKGCLLVGPPGTGKTLAAQVSAKTLGFPLVSVDTAAVMSAGAIYLKRLLERVEACTPAVLYFDEFDKLFAASDESGEAIGSRQILGTLLTWLQDKKTAVFTIATLNRLDALPPELTRVGRFDEIFYVGFPQAIERKEILIMHLGRFDERYRNGSNPLSEKEWRIILNKTLNCTGAELARIVSQAARELFHQGQEMKIGLEQLLAQREAMVPLYVRDTDRILAIENQARYICQPSSTQDTSVFAPAITSYWGESS
ncbi:ATP-binding protein [Tolypothrix tenuis]|uniref:ATP-binding protein n=1 Tax=Tolypothrix tenuis TaxID=457083 RepID=UPI0030D98300